MTCYAGIGSRRTPPDIQTLMSTLASTLAQQGWTLRSGHADGADLAFERGAAGNAEIYLPWPTFNQPPPVQGTATTRPAAWTYQQAAAHHAGWGPLRDPIRALMARNVHQILGATGLCPSAFVVCWTPDGATTGAATTRQTGGTGHAIRAADHHGIPILNLARPDHLERAHTYVLKGPRA